MSLSCFTRISQQCCFKRMSIRTKQISQRDFFFFYQLRPIPWGKVDNFWQDFFQMPAFPFLDIFCPLVPPLARCLKFKGRRKSMLLIWSYVLKSVKIYQLRPTSRCLLITLEGLVVQFMWISPKQLSTPPMSFILAKNMPIMELT